MRVRWARSDEYLSACGGRGQWVGRGVTMTQSPPFHATQQQHLYSMVTKVSPETFLVKLAPVLQAVSSHLTAVPFQGSLSKPHVPAHNPPPYKQTHVSGWGAWGCSMDRECRSYSVLPSTDNSAFPLIPKLPLSADFPMRTSLKCRNLSSPLAPLRVLVPSHFPLFVFLSLVLPGCVGIFLVLLGVQGYSCIIHGYSVRFVPLVDVFLVYL